jgi:hypothetical protein
MPSRVPSIDELAEDYQFFGEQRPILDMQVLQGHGVAMLAGAGGALVNQAVFTQERVMTYFADKPGMSLLAQIALGIAGGRAIYHFEGGGEHPAAYGFVGATAGIAAAGGAMMLYNQYAAPAVIDAPVVTDAPVVAGMRGLAYTGVRQVAPYYDRYKVSVPGGSRADLRGLSGEVVTRANYMQTHGLRGLGEGNGNGNGAAPVDENGWPVENEEPEVGAWIG